MLPIPAIDIRDGRCVRLLRGDFSLETVYGDPVEQAVAFDEQGAPMLHIVDLDAARSGEATNDRIVRQIRDAIGIPLQVGGGIRDRARAEELIKGGVDRVVIGTLAVEDPATARELAEAFPLQVVVGLDHRSETDGNVTRRLVAVRGWEHSLGVELKEALDALAGPPFAGVVITDISKDGTLEGPDLDGYRYALGATELDIIASGGVGSLADLEALSSIEVNGRSLAGVIVGRALLMGTFNIEEAVAACAP